MRRRDFMSGLGSAAVVLPFAARAQQSAVPVVGYLQTGAPDLSTRQVAAFRRGLSETGYVEGRNVAIEYRFAEGQYDRLPAMAADLVQRRIAVIAAAGGGYPTQAAKAATSTIPIVFVTGDTDPVQAGFVASLSHPAGNVTGVSSLLGALTTKRIGLLHELMPKATAVGMLANPNTLSVATQIEEAKKAAQTIGVALHVLYAGSGRGLDTVFATMGQRGIGALLVAADAFFGSRRGHLIRLAEHKAIPTSYYHREFVEEGGLMSYATPLADMYRQARIYTGRILGGAKPADLPVVQPTKFELVINRKTAKTLGIEIPPMLLALTDEVIE